LDGTLGIFDIFALNNWLPWWFNIELNSSSFTMGHFDGSVVSSGFITRVATVIRSGTCDGVSVGSAVSVSVGVSKAVLPIVGVVVDLPMIVEVTAGAHAASARHIRKLNL
jgi:hypothetical protein